MDTKGRIKGRMVKMRVVTINCKAKRRYGKVRKPQRQRQQNDNKLGKNRSKVASFTEYMG